MPDIAVGQGLLQFGDTRVGDLAIVVKAERLQLGQPLQMFQPRVGDFGFFPG